MPAPGENAGLQLTAARKIQLLLTSQYKRNLMMQGRSEPGRCGMIDLHTIKALAIANALALSFAAFFFPAAAQSSDTDFQFLNRIYEVSNSVDDDTAQQAFKSCHDLGKELAARTDMEAAVKLNFEAEIESCLSYAMSHGEFTDESGDECAHHFAAAEKFTAAILTAHNKAGVRQEQLTNLRERLHRLSETGPQRGCTGDYAKLIQSLPAADAIVPPDEAGIPDKRIMEAISGATHGITDKDSAEWLRKCRAFSADVAARPARNPVERTYLEGQIENCVATAMARGNMSDGTGDVCFHHHQFASKLAETLALNTKAAFLESGFREYVSEELKIAKRQGPGMGCKQNYESLKADEARQ